VISQAFNLVPSLTAWQNVICPAGWPGLRSAGMTPRQLRRLVTTEALAVAVLASGTGCALAVPYAGGLAAALRAIGLAPAGIPDSVTPGPFVLALAAGVLVTLVAARAPASRQARERPT
jgi:putative ABC transport system permease protein